MSVMIALRIDETLVAQVDRERRRRSLSRTKVVEEALALWLERHRTEEAVRRHREAYARMPVGEQEFEPVLRSQRWPK